MTDKSALKMIVIGSPGVGKSSILNRYTTNDFKESYKTTLGVQFCSKNVNIDNNTSIKLQIWDTAGQQSFQSIVNTFYRNVSMVFLVYSITSIESFKDLEFWYGQAIEHCQPDVVMVLIGSKSDKQEERQVSKQQAQQFMKEKGIAFMFQTSAKQNINIDLAFSEAAKQAIFNRIKNPKTKNTTSNDNNQRLSLNNNTLTSERRCCK